MRIYLIYPDVNSFHGLPYHPGLASIASMLMTNGHEVRIGYFYSLDKVDDILRQIDEFKPHVVGFTAVETQFRYVKYLASRIKKTHRCIIICGGPYTTLYPEVMLEDDVPIDAVIVGEGEYPMVELVEKLGNGNVWLDTNNLVYKGSKTNTLIKTPLSHFTKDLDSLPRPKTELFPYQNIIDHENMAMFHFNRGCPYRCSFCSNEALGQAVGFSSNTIRYRSVESAIDEINTTLPKYKLYDDTMLYFSDDLFTYNKRWISDFCALYRKKINRPFWCTGRSNHITQELCASLKDAGCVMLMMSVESGNDYIRNEVMSRNISRETLFESFELCYKYGINTLATCIIGLPFETREMIEDSIKTVAQLKSIASYGINIFYPYKGTYLRRVCEENNFIPKVVDGSFIERRDSILSLPQLPKGAILYYYDNWTKLIMKHKNKRDRMKYALRECWNSLRKTPIGQQIRAIVNKTKFGKVFKRYMMKHIWNRS